MTGLINESLNLKEEEEGSIVSDSQLISIVNGLCVETKRTEPCSGGYPCVVGSPECSVLTHQTDLNLVPSILYYD